MINSRFDSLRAFTESIGRLRNGTDTYNHTLEGYLLKMSYVVPQIERITAVMTLPRKKIANYKSHILCTHLESRNIWYVTCTVATNWHMK